MATSSSWARASCIPLAVVCLCLIPGLQAQGGTETVSDMGGGEGGFLQALGDFFESLVRKRRQLPPRRDDAKEGFTEEERQAMLLLHNSYRSLANPTAANMREVRWNSQIESFAQAWTSQCRAQHQSNRNLGSWTNMGENIFWNGGNRYQESTAVNFWWNEYRFYSFDTNSCESGKECGHYKTVAWATSAYMGCGIKRCDSLSGISVPSSVYLIICNYSGTILNSRPFEAGTSCSNCPADFPRCRYNLCVTQSMLDNCEGYNGSTIYIPVTRNSSVTNPMNCPGFVVDPGNQTPTPTPRAGSSSSSTTQSSMTTTEGGGSAVAALSTLTFALCLGVDYVWSWRMRC